jgi:hypothetical protein
VRKHNPAETLLQSLGVTEPEEIDLESIAWHLGIVRIKYRELDGCEARIVGLGDKAIITVDRGATRRRRRFSIGHELGHWHLHRGMTLLCQREDIGESSGVVGSEKAANEFAADLLLPSYLLLPLARRHRQITVNVLREIAGRFDTSLSATAIRLAEASHSALIVVCHGLHGRRWFVRSSIVPRRWFPREELDCESYAFDILHGTSSEQPSPRKIGADAWFDRYDADRYEIQEQSFKVSDDEILTILTLYDEDMLEDR